MLPFSKPLAPGPKTSGLYCAVQHKTIVQFSIKQP